MSVPYAIVITHKVNEKRAPQRLPTPKRLARAMEANKDHPVLPAQYPLRPTTEEDGPLAILGYTYDLHVPVRIIGMKENRSLAGWYMPGLCGDDRPFGALGTGWPLEEQFLEPLRGAVSFDRVVYTTTAPTAALRALKALGEAAAKAHETVGVPRDAAQGAAEEHVTTMRGEINRANPTIKRIDQPVLVDLERQLLFVGAGGVALEAALEALRSLLSVASLPEGADDEVQLALDPQVHLWPLNMELWLWTKRHEDSTMASPLWVVTFGNWLMEQLRDGPLYVSLRSPDQCFRVHIGHSMRLTAGDGKGKHKWQVQLPESRSDDLTGIADAVLKESGFSNMEGVNTEYQIEITDAYGDAPAYVGIDAGKITGVDVTVKPLGLEASEAVAGSKDAVLNSADRLDMASNRGLHAAAVIDVYAVMEVLWTACFGDNRNAKQTVIPSTVNPTMAWPIAPRSGLLYTEAELASAEGSDKRAAELRRGFGV